MRAATGHLTKGHLPKGFLENRMKFTSIACDLRIDLLRWSSCCIGRAAASVELLRQLTY
jgi:hypothetical protein